MEESGVEIADIRYVCSMKINDWRYRGTESCIKTAFFTAKYIFGRPEGADDVAEAKWFKYSEIKPEHIVEEHRPLLEKLALAWKV
jgi:NADH pyrophosphatase NudC (nudix superfamily)